MRRKLLAWSVLVVFLILAWSRLQAPDDKLHLVFCDVGQGDGAVVMSGSFQMLIDTGPKGGGIVDCLSRQLPFWDRRLEVVLNSHPEADHLGDLAAVAGRYQIEALVMDGKSPTRDEVAAVVRELVESGTKLQVAAAGDIIRYGSLVFDVLWPEGRSSDLVGWLNEGETAGLPRGTGLNQYSLVVKLAYGQFSALFSGDVSEAEEKDIKGLTNIDLLKVAHHGSKYSSAREFLEVVRPVLAVISVGKNNYGHPTAEALDRLGEIGARIWRTDEQGELEIVSDGKSFWVK